MSWQRDIRIKSKRDKLNFLVVREGKMNGWMNGDDR